MDWKTKDLCRAVSTHEALVLLPKHRFPELATRRRPSVETHSRLNREGSSVGRAAFC